jgi:SAM-dependent methyltransferase
VAVGERRQCRAGGRQPLVIGLSWRRIARALTGGPAAVQTEDRRVLEKVIFAHYSTLADVRTVLFVGCESYTKHYERCFLGHNYWTIDADPGRRRFGGKQHVIGRLEQLRQHFPAGFFDLIVCNGVYGWGLNRAEDCETALRECHACLADDGHLVFGWNDIPRWDPAPLASIQGFSRFAEYVVPTLGSKYRTETAYRHTYRFLQKTRGQP